MRDFLLVVGSVILGLILLALGAAAINGGFHTGKASNLVAEITLVESNARAGFSQSNAGYANFVTANISTLAGGGMFPSSMVRSGTLYDDWGNTITLASANNATNGVITFGGGNSEDTDQCKTVVMGLKDYVSLKVGTSTFTQTTQPDASTAISACGTAGTATIAVTFQ
jgi:hypothetical protein